MNVQRHRRIEELKVERVREELSIAEQRYFQHEDRRNLNADNRQHLRMLYLRRRHDLNQYFSYGKHFA